MKHRKLPIIFIYFFSFSFLLIGDSTSLSHEDIFYAAQRGDVATIQTLIKNKQKLDIKDKDGNTLLHVATKYGHAALVRLLASHAKLYRWQFPNINAINNNGNTALHEAIDTDDDDDNLEILIDLIWNNADVNAFDKEKRTALLRAAEQNKKKKTLCLMGMCDEYYDHTVAGNNILHFAVSHDDPELSEKIITINQTAFLQVPERTGHNALIKAKNDNNETVLLCGVKKPHVQILKLLLPIITEQTESIIDVPDNSGYTPFAYVCSKHIWNKELVDLFLPYKPAYNTPTFSYAMPLNIVLKSGHYDLAKKLLDNGAHINACDSERGNTPLHNVIEESNDTVKVEWLLKNGADIHRHNKLGCDAIDIAINKKNREFITMFITRGGNIDRLDTKGRSRLMKLLSNSKNNDMAEYLIGLKANTDVTDQDGTTILHVATKNYNFEGARLVLKNNKTLLNQKDKYGNSALHYGADNPRSSTFVQLYIVQGALIDDKNAYGETPIHRAVVAGNIESIQYLKKSKASLAILTQKNSSPAHYALMHNKYNCLPLVLDKEVIDVVNDDHKTIFQLAIEKGLPLHILQKIVEAGANVNVTFKNTGASYLHHALLCHNKDAINLLAIPSLVNKNDNDNSSPLSYAVQQNDSASVKLLLSRGAALNVADNNGWTELHHSIAFSDGAMFKLLEERGSLDKRDKEGNTCLHIAAQYNNTDVIADKIMHDPDSAIRQNDKGEIPFMTAVLSNQLEATERLMHDNYLNDGTVETVLRKIGSLSSSNVRRFLEKKVREQVLLCDSVIHLQNEQHRHIKLLYDNSSILDKMAVGCYLGNAYKLAPLYNQAPTYGFDYIRRMSSSDRNEHIRRLQVDIINCQSKNAEIVERIYTINHDKKEKELERQRALQEQEYIRQQVLIQQKQLQDKRNVIVELQNTLGNLIKVNTVTSSLINQRAIKEYAHYQCSYAPSDTTNLIYSLDAITKLSNAQLCQHEAYLENYVRTEQKKYKEMICVLEKMNQSSSHVSVNQHEQENEVTVSIALDSDNNDAASENECDLCNELKVDAKHRCSEDRCDKKICLGCMNAWRAKGKTTCPYCTSGFK